MEHVRPSIVDAERAFYRSRTAGEREQLLRDLTHNSAYRSDEYTRKDKFVHPYMGKEYADYYELLTMGLEDLFNPAGIGAIKDDREMMEWLIGLLASA